ncbi:condensation domain-containing protein, partial [Nocardia sp. NPDC004582]
PLDRARPARPVIASARVDYLVPGEIRARLDHIARGRDASLFTVVHAAVTILLARVSGGTDIVTGAAVPGRVERVTAGVVGAFENVVALRATVDPAGCFDDLVVVARDTALSAFDNADLPFERVAEAVTPDARSLVQVVLTPQHHEPAEFEAPGLIAAEVDAGLTATEFDLRIGLDAHPPGTDGAPGDLAVVFTYAPALFDESTVEALGAGLMRVLAAAAADPRTPMRELLDRAVRSRAEPAPVVPAVVTTAPGAALPRSLSLVVEDDPEGPALVRGEASLSYRELDARSSRLSRVLIGRGCGPGTGVGLRLDRGVDWAVATWAVLKAGAAVVPLGTLDRLPPAGLDMKIGLTTGTPTMVSGIDWLALDDPGMAAEIAAESAGPVTYAHRTRALRGDDIAFSGPGRTPLSYDTMAALVQRIRSDTGLTFESRTYQAGAVDHPLAALEVIASGSAGASMVLAGPGADLAETLDEEWVTHLFAEHTVLNELGRPRPEDLRAIVADTVPDPSRWPGVTASALPEVRVPMDPLVTRPEWLSRSRD